ncbi:hypothetical protein ACROYT_G022756 [Oculina patagonica]
MPYVFLLQYLFFSWLSPLRTMAQDGDCRVLKFNPDVEGYALHGHVFKSFTVQRESACEARCFVEHNCVSYNLGPLDEDETYICELSDSDHQMHPEALVRQYGFTYRPTENACSRNPCSPDLLCQNGFTDKGYRCIINTHKPKVVMSSTAESLNPPSQVVPTSIQPESSNPSIPVSAISSTSPANSSPNPTTSSTKNVLPTSAVNQLKSRTTTRAVYQSKSPTPTRVSTLSSSSLVATSPTTNVVTLSSSSSVATSIAANVAPSVTVDPQSKTVEEGGTATFTCSATGQPQPEVKWNKSEGSLPASRTTIHDGMLTVMNADVGDSGLYVCTATNAVGSNSSGVTLKVIRLSSTVSTSLLVYIGQNKTIKCPVTTEPHSNILWMNKKTSTLPDGVVNNGPKELQMNFADIRHDGIYTCVVRNLSSPIQTAGMVTVHIRYPETCSRVKANVTDVSGHYVIDPDGVLGTAPFEVFCNMTDKGGVGVTVVSHDTENRTHVNGCGGDGCYKRDVKYTGASVSQLTVLTKASAFCEQFISYECKHSRIFRGGKAWWVSRDGAGMEYWGGATADNKEYCACGLTNTCADGERCNCDADDDVWREDSGLLTEKLYLPVSQLRFGDTDDKDEEGYHILGKLICYGIP